jgi:hypothetical protein
MVSVHLQALSIQRLIIMATGKGLEQLTNEALVKGFQVSETNPILGLESRADLLRGLGKSLLAQSKVFGVEGRPGNVVGSFTYWKI